MSRETPAAAAYAVGAFFAEHPELPRPVWLDVTPGGAVEVLVRRGDGQAARSDDQARADVDAWATALGAGPAETRPATSYEVTAQIDGHPVTVWTRTGTNP